MFNYIDGIEDLFYLHNVRYPKAVQLNNSNISYDRLGVDLHKLSKEDQLLTLRGKTLNVKCWLVETEEDLNKLFKYIQDFDFVCFDTETTSITEPKLANILLWSITVNSGEAFVIPYMFNSQMLNYFTTTEQKVVAYNMGFDGMLIKHHGGSFPKNFDDPYLYNRVLYNDTVLAPPLSLKVRVKDQFGIWSDETVKSNISNLTEDVLYDEDILFYSGVDSIALYVEYTKNRDKIEKEIDVDIFDLLPHKHPVHRSYSREYFYKNVLKQLLPLSAELVTTGLPLNMDRVHKLDVELDEILGKADIEVLQLPVVIKCFDKFKKDKAQDKVDKYKNSVDVNKVKIYKSTNQLYINMFIELMYPNKILPDKSKNWTSTIIKTFDPVLAEHIKNKNLDRLRYADKYADIFIAVEDKLRELKVVEKVAKSEDTATNIFHKAILDLEFKPLTSSTQKKYIFNEGFKISSYNKSMTTGEDSFDKDELSRLSKEVPKDTELGKFIELCVIYSGGNIIKKNFVANFKKYVTKDNRIHSNFNIGKAKSMRPTSSDRGINLLNLPSSRSVFSKPIKSCITVPSNDWVWITADYSFLEVACNAIITEDRTLLKGLLEDRDAHCTNSSAYFKEEIESILGPNDGSIEWNKRYKEATETNSRLDKLRSNSKGITFALSYLSAVKGLLKAVGYFGDTFDSEIAVKDYKYTLNMTSMTSKDGREFTVGDKNGDWYDIEDYKRLDEKYHNFFETGLIPAKNMHYTFHNELYSDSKAYREEKIIKQVMQHNNIHMGMGAYINQTKKLGNGSIRTLWNVSFQFYSILTLLAFEKFRRIVVQEGRSKDFQFVASVYDSVYFLCKRDQDTIRWAAKTLKKIMVEDFIEDQKLSLKADLEISTDSWADFKKLDNIDNLEEYINSTKKK